MDKLNAIMDSSRAKTKESYDLAMVKALEVRDQALVKMNINPEDLEKLNKVPLIATIVGVFVNILLLAAISTNGWATGTALKDGQPFRVHLSLGSAIFGPPDDPTRDSAAFCGEGRGSCGLSELCAMPDSVDVFANGMPKSTSQDEWCSAANAGGIVGGLLGFGFLPGLAATFFTFLLAAKDIASVSPLFDKAEELGLREEVQKYVVAACWGALWLFMFLAMAIYSAAAPNELGWGTVTLEGSFGLLRLSLVLISVSAGVLVSHMFELWLADNVTEAWVEFVETSLCSAKKLLYLELMTQMVLYLFLTVYMIDWALVLVILVGYYLDAKAKNFKLMYICLVLISIFFDVMRLAALPSYSQMTSGESFGNTVWTFIFFLKPIILVTIYFYEKENEDANGFAQMEEGQGVDNDEIAE